MNITPQFVKSPPFIKFERLTGASAYKYIALLGMYCQQSRNADVTIEEPLDLELLVGADDNGEKILTDLIKCKLIEKVDEVTYSCTFFIDQNKQLLSNWNNGAMKAKKAKQVSAIENLSKAVLDDVDQHFVDFYQSDDWKQREEIIKQDYEENVEWRETNEG
tara:strand:+ start:148 stop:633 length:486 start_codon:yes stop_codon:yes gene_type:complete